MNMTKRMLIKNLIDDVFMLLALDFIVFRFKIAYIIAKLKMKYIYKNDANIHKAKAYLKWVEREVEREKDDFMLVRRIRYAWKRIFRLGQ